MYLKTVPFLVLINYLFRSKKFYRDQINDAIQNKLTITILNLFFTTNKIDFGRE